MDESIARCFRSVVGTCSVREIGSLHTWVLLYVLCSLSEASIYST